MSGKAIITTLFFLILICGKTQSQSQSVSLNYGYPYYFMQGESYGDYDVKNDFNHTVGFSIGNYFNSSTIEVGISFGTKNYSFIYTDINSSEKREKFKIKYFIFPLTFSQRVYSNSKNTFALLAGIAFIKPFGHSSVTELANGSYVKKESIPVMYEVGSNARLGIKYSRRIAQHFFLCSQIHGDYKFDLDYTRASPRLKYSNLTDDRFSIGINVGVEWIFNSTELIGYQVK